VDADDEEDRDAAQPVERGQPRERTAGIVVRAGQAGIITAATR
jgi:hypothetical protein